MNLIGLAQRPNSIAYSNSTNYAFARDQHGLMLAFQGRLRESQSEGKLATELDPLSPQILLDVVFSLVWDGKFQQAMELGEEAAELDQALDEREAFAVNIFSRTSAFPEKKKSLFD